MLFRSKRHVPPGPTTALLDPLLSALIRVIRVLRWLLADQLRSLPRRRAPPSQTPMAVPRLVRKKFRTRRATRLRHQPRTVAASSRRAMKSPWVGLRIHASTSALIVPEASAEIGRAHV